MKKTIFLLSIIQLISCGGDKENNAEQIFVYTSAEAIQCQFGGNTLATSAQPLIENGIDVVESACAYMTGVAIISTCGAPTIDINLHKIDASNLNQAEELGYFSVNKLENNKDSGYRVSSCDHRGIYY